VLFGLSDDPYLISEFLRVELRHYMPFTFKEDSLTLRFFNPDE
jgi:hypothetical protein